MQYNSTVVPVRRRFSALQRAEIAEMPQRKHQNRQARVWVSVLFNEPKLLKLPHTRDESLPVVLFQCSSTSRNC